MSKTKAKRDNLVKRWLNNVEREKKENSEVKFKELVKDLYNL